MSKYVNNTVIEEVYVSFELAKLLKEKGFDVSCLSTYDINNGKQYFHTSYIMCATRINAPTHQMACAWLREKYGYHIYTFYENEFHWHYVIDSLTKKWRYSVSENKTNDEAIEKALKYTLENLI